MRMAGLGKCANPDCGTEFKRLGTGRIYTSHVRQPQAWGLPAHTRQKVVWLCGQCATSHRVVFDQEHCQVLVVNNGDSASTREWAAETKARFPVLAQEKFSVSKRYVIWQALRPDAIRRRPDLDRT